jgi:hypothetical protein
MIRGIAKFDAIAVGEFTVNFLGPTTKVTAKAAFVATESGFTHGWTTNESWSPETIQKLRELRQAMETDLARIHFGADAAMPGQEGLQVPTAGLAEFLNEQDGRSI